LIHGWIGVSTVVTLVAVFLYSSREDVAWVAVCCSMYVSTKSPTDKIWTGVQARLAEEAGVQARLTEKASKEIKISQDQNDWILVTKTRRHRMPKQQESKVMKKRKVSAKAKRDAMTETVSKRSTFQELKDPREMAEGIIQLIRFSLR
jgi:hypothetical protein